MARNVQGAGSVYPRKDGRFAASASFEGKRITKYGKTKKEAWDKLQAALDDLKAGKVVIGPKQTVKQYLEHWLEDVHRLEIELTSLARYRSVLHAHLIPAFGHLQLAGLTRERIQAFYVEKLDAGFAPATIGLIHAVLTAALKDAVIHRVLPHNPCEYVKLPKKKGRKQHGFTLDECKRLLIAARGHRLWFMLLVALTTGARIGELCALHWEDFDLDNSRIHLHRNCAWVKGFGLIEKQPKTESGSRKVILAQVVIDGIEQQREYIESLRAHAGSRWNELDLVFPNKYGRYLHPNRVRDALEVISSNAGFSIRRFHRLRHSAATVLFAAGVNPKVVQEALGHSDISITLGMYGDVTPDMQQGVADVMNRLFEE